MYPSCAQYPPILTLLLTTIHVVKTVELGSSQTSPLVSNVTLGDFDVQNKTENEDSEDESEHSNVLSPVAASKVISNQALPTRTFSANDNNQYQPEHDLPSAVINNISTFDTQTYDISSSFGLSREQLQTTSYLNDPQTPCNAWKRRAECTAPSNSSLTCFGTKLGHSRTSLALTGLQQAWQVRKDLQQWSGLKSVPACWEAVQPLLCAVYMPRCDEGMVQLVPQHLCKAAVGPCRVISELTTELPFFLQCNNTTTFSRKCRKEQKVKKPEFNISSSCSFPLVPTTDTAAFFSSVSQCGMRCQSPLLTEEEHDRIHRFVAVTGGLCLTVTLLAVITFLLDWRGANRYPALAVFYINVCFVLATVGWLAQFLPGAREDIVCRQDGTLRQAEPGSGESLSCVVIFILIYYFTIAATVWFVVLSYSWYVSFEAIGKVKELIDKKVAYFHMVAWSLPLVLTIIILAMNQVDGSSITGVCFVGYKNPYVRSLFLLLPLILTLLTGGYFIVKSIKILANVSLSSDLISDKATSKIQATLMRIGMFSFLILVCIVVTVASHIYDFKKSNAWEQSLHDFVICNIRSMVYPDTGSGPCKDTHIEDKPSVPMIEIQLLCMFGAGILSSSWVWTTESFSTWKMTLKQLLSKEAPKRPVKLKKHELIAQAFAKRQELAAQGRLSLTFQSAHEDPVGINIELNSATSGDFSSTWAAALPHLVQRRGGLCGEAAMGLRRNSVESINSNFSHSVSIKSGRFSWLDSRRHSVESQSLGVGVTDLDRLQSIYDESIKREKKRSKRHFFKSHAGKVRPWSRFSSRRNSVTSRNSDNSSVSQVLPAITLDPTKLVGAAAMFDKKKTHGYQIPEPGQSTDFGQTPVTRPAEDPGFRELEEKLRQLANASRTSQNTDRDVGVQMSVEAAPSSSPHQCSVSVQTSLTDLSIVGQRKHFSSVGTQMTPEPVHREVLTTETSTEPSSKGGDWLPLQHIEANVVSIKVLGPSSEESSIPSSYERDYTRNRSQSPRKISPRGKENIVRVLADKVGESVELDIDELQIPMIKPLSKVDGPIIRPRDHHRGRRGAIVSPAGAGGLPATVPTPTTATDTASS